MRNVVDFQCYRLVLRRAAIADSKFLKDCLKLRGQKVSVKFEQNDQNLWDVVSKSLQSSQFACLEFEIDQLEAETTYAVPIRV